MPGGGGGEGGRGQVPGAGGGRRLFLPHPTSVSPESAAGDGDVRSVLSTPGRHNLAIALVVMPLKQTDTR